MQPAPLCLNHPGFGSEKDGINTYHHITSTICSEKPWATLQTRGFCQNFRTQGQSDSESSVLFVGWLGFWLVSWFGDFLIIVVVMVCLMVGFASKIFWPRC